MTVASMKVVESDSQGVAEAEAAGWVVTLPPAGLLWLALSAGFSCSTCLPPTGREPVAQGAVTVTVAAEAVIVVWATVTVTVAGAAHFSQLEPLPPLPLLPGTGAGVLVVLARVMVTVLVEVEVAVVVTVSSAEAGGVMVDLMVVVMTVGTTDCLSPVPRVRVMVLVEMMSVVRRGGCCWLGRAEEAEDDLCCSMIFLEMVLASVIGQTVVVKSIVSVTVLIWRALSGIADISGLPTGQLVTVGAQLVMVEVRVDLTVSVVRAPAGVGVGVTVGARAEEAEPMGVAELCFSMTEEEMALASLTGQIVVVRSIVSVTVWTWRALSGMADISGLPAGQLVTVGAQLMMVEVRVVWTVRVVMASEGRAEVPLARGKCRWRPGVKAAATAA